ncbi:MAG: septum formation inhibitor Maf [Lachnospiraceae bacterium]|nr:septum formation inhibitor Maf [Lachnospiraceae bacterium]
MCRFILASGSPRRRELLNQIGISHEVIPSDVDESMTETEPAQVVEELSRRKALDVAGKIQAQTQTIILGADTVVTLDGEILGKPTDTEKAFEMLHSLQGRKHTVYTGVTIVSVKGNDRQVHTFHESTAVEIYPMNENEIRAYIATKDPMDKAGAYGIQGAFAAYIRGIAGDYYTVVGLPVGRLAQELKTLRYL